MGYKSSLICMKTIPIMEEMINSPKKSVQNVKPLLEKITRFLIENKGDVNSVILLKKKYFVFFFWRNIQRLWGIYIIADGITVTLKKHMNCTPLAETGCKIYFNYYLI